MTIYHFVWMLSMVPTRSSIRKFYFLFLFLPLLALGDPNRIPFRGLRASPTSSPAPSVAAAGCSDDGSVIDVMLGYSKSMCGHSGLWF